MSQEKTSARIAALASQAMRAPETLTLDEIKALDLDRVALDDCVLFM